MAHQKVGPFGTLIGGVKFDDGNKGYAGVNSVTVGFEANRFVFLEVEYVEGDGKTTAVVSHGEKPVVTSKFSLRHVRGSGGDEEYITEVEGTLVQDSLRTPMGYITSVTFVTNRQKRSLTFGNPTGDVHEEPFVLKADGGKKLVSFFGRAAVGIHNLGAYFAL